MRQVLVFGAGCAVAFAMVVGCSSQDSKPEAGTSAPAAAASSEAAAAPTAPGGSPVAPDVAHVTLAGNDAGPVTSVVCDTQQGLTTITVQATQPATVVVTDEDAPAVKSVSIGAVGPNGPTLAYLAGVAATPAQATRDGGKYTVSGTGLGSDPADASRPIDMPFEILVTCP